MATSLWKCPLVHGLVLTVIFLQSSEGKTISIDTIACCNHVVQLCLVNIVHLSAKHVNGGCGDGSDYAVKQ